MSKILVAGLVCSSLVGFLLFLIRSYLVVVTLSGQSMYPTLQHGDRVLAIRRWPVRWVRRGQVVLVWPWLPSDTRLRSLQEVEIYIKRVVAVAGDSITTSITDLYPDMRQEQVVSHDANGRREWVIPASHIFVRGDNLLGGYDSLTWGPIPVHTVLAVILMKLSSSTRK